MQKALNIVMISGHGCIRVHKMAIPLIEKGHNVHLIASKMSGFWEQYKTFTLCYDTEHFLNTFKVFADTGKVDVFHCHNEPSWFVSALKEMTNIPVILDIHDSYLARTTPEEATEGLDRGDIHIRVTAEERNNFQLADGLVYPGEYFRETVSTEYKLDQPSLTLPSYVPKRLYKYQSRDWHGGLVYEGKVNLPEENKGAHTGFSYCDYTDLAHKTNNMKMDFHIYAGRMDEKFKKHYWDIAFLHKPLLYDEMLDSIGRHDWGLVGNTTKTREWDVAMPNKLFEYLATGVPVVSMNASDCSKFLTETGMGITVDSPEELGERWREHRDTRKKVFRHRQDWSMNAHINKLEDFYRGFA